MPKRDRAEYARKRYAADPARARELLRASYAKHADKRRAEAVAKYHEDPEKSRERQRESYARNKEARAAYAREYRKRNREAVNARAREKARTGGDELKARRKGYRAKHYAKIYARIQAWREENPDKELRYHAKRLINEATGLRMADIPEDLVDAKIAQLLILRWARDGRLPEQEIDECPSPAARRAVN